MKTNKYNTASEILYTKKNSSFLKNYLTKLYEGARYLNDSNILNLIEKNSKAKIIDLGCDDGNFTYHMGKRAKTKFLYGLDIIPERLKIAKTKGIKTIKSNLNNPFPMKDESFDVVHANQVIEHVTDLDNFVGEIFRILKPGGYAIISTENASSWCNIFASIMGWQMFSLTNFSKKSWGLGNPFALHKDESHALSSWTHKTILNIKGLHEFFQLYGFQVEKVMGAGYFPLPNKLGRIDVVHAHFMTFKVRKPL